MQVPRALKMQINIRIKNIKATRVKIQFKNVNKTKN